MALTYNWPLVPFPVQSHLHPSSHAQVDEDTQPRENSEVVGQLVEDIIRTASLNSQKHCHKVCHDILIDSIGLMLENADVVNKESGDDIEQSSLDPPEEDCQGDGGPGKFCQDVLMSLVAEVVKDPKLICKDIVSDFVESIEFEPNRTSNKKPTVALKILKALDNLYK